MDKKKKIAIIILIIAIVLILLSFFTKKEEYTVSVDTAGGIEIANKVVKEGTTIGELEVPTKDGYKFLYWTLDGEKCKDSDKITKDIHLIAVWEADGNTEVTKYKVTFNVDGGSVVESVEVEEGNVLVKPEEPKKEGYTFVEWQLDGVVFDFTTKITKDIELKAIWKEENEVTVSFDSNGGSKVTSQVLKENEVAKKPANPTKSGYKFVEWQLDGKAYDFSNKVTKDIKLVAKWEKLVTYTVTFDSNGGSKVDSKTVEKDTTVSKPNNPTKNGYKFVEWQLDGKAYNFGSKVTKNIKLVAKWEKVITYTVTFDSDGGSNVSSKTVEKDKTVSKPGNPTKSGYKFVEWQLDGKAYNFGSKVTKDITLKAVWKKVSTYTVAFNSNGGTNVASQTVTEGSKAKQPSNPTKAGHTFVEWQLNGNKYDFTKAVNGNITLTAKWNQKSYTVSVELVNSGDSFSPDRMLTVYENGTKVSVSSIKYKNGTVLCYGNNLAVNMYDIQGVTQLTVVLSDGKTEVTATIK